ncbi:hypothetical protein HDU96_010382 [Phlyctochytrium bullatum]|nr:hypothetical protein HDU96_010382 [Phlyctochytrium bullatum]
MKAEVRPDPAAAAADEVEHAGHHDLPCQKIRDSDEVLQAHNSRHPQPSLRTIHTHPYVRMRNEERVDESAAQTGRHGLEQPKNPDVEWEFFHSPHFRCVE